MIDTYIGHTGDAIKLIDELLEEVTNRDEFADLDLVEQGLLALKNALERGII